uniref:Uncharacterized protein n=1 Tax=Meloidogyne enterolobii TaxID=390850 RepID=A0A6V7XG74_MELEN|nr:unnamed protein product [Meloidogyne enterolobii]
MKLLILMLMNLLIITDLEKKEVRLIMLILDYSEKIFLSAIEGNLIKDLGLIKEDVQIK